MVMRPSVSEPAVDIGGMAREPKASLREQGLTGLLSTLIPAASALFLFWTALQSVFIALQVKAIDPDGAAGALAQVIGIGAIGALLAAPIAGALSDRTRTRFGGRVPWILGGGVATAFLAVLLAGADSIAELSLYWLLIQISTNFIFTPIIVHIPERVPLARRGIFSSAIGISNLLGVLGGQVIGAAFANELFTGYLVVSGALIVALLAFAAVNRRSNIGLARAPFSFAAIARSFWVNPVQHPGFGWAFLGRFLFLTGFFPLKVYLLYILQDYIGLGDKAIGTLPAMGIAAMVGAAIGTPLAGWLSDRFNVTRPLIYICSTLMIAAIIIPIVSPTYTAMIIYSALVGAGFGGFASVDYVLITKVLPSDDDAGKDLGIINMTTTLSQTLGVGLAGAIVSQVDSYGALFPMGIVFIALGTVCIAFIKGVR